MTIMALSLIHCQYLVIIQFIHVDNGPFTDTLSVYCDNSVYT